MSFFVSKNLTLADEIMRPDQLMRSNPEYYGPRFEAIRDLRQQDDGTLYKGAGFRHVASFVNVPLFQAMKVLSPEFLKDKKNLYAFIDRNPAYCAYQRRRGSRPIEGQVTYVDGVAQ